MKLGMFVHFGLYSIVGKGEWYMFNEQVPSEKYEKLLSKFKVKKSWAKDIVRTARGFGAKYIVLTTRHHDGFSLYDTKGLTTYDVMHTPTKRDLVKEFVDECNKNDIVPFFYCTLIDWHNKDFKDNFDIYRKYLLDSITLLCTNYGKVGGFWFDGTWFNQKLDWKLNDIYSIIRKYQPDAIIANNGGLENVGEILHKEIDCTIFEKNTPLSTNSPDKKHRAKEKCQTLNDHWGYYKCDNNYKSIGNLFNDYLLCQKHKANLLLNVGPKRNGIVKHKEKVLLRKLGAKIIKENIT